MKKFICILLVLLLGGTLVYANEQSEVTAENPIVWTHSDYTPASGALARLQLQIFDELFKRSGGRLKVNPHFGGALGSAQEELMLIGEGVAQITYLSTLFFPGELPLCNVTWLPFLSTQYICTSALASDELFRTSEAINQELESYNIVYGGSVANDHYNLVSMKPIRTVKDFKDKKIRCSSVQGDILKQFGATRATIAGPEIYGAMQTGLIDTHMHYWDCFYKYRTYELANYYTYGLNMGVASGIMIINKDAWEALPEDLKEVYISVRDMMPRMARAAFRDSEQIPKQLEDFKKEGIEFIKFPAEEREILIEAAKPVWEEWANQSRNPEIAREVLNEYINIIEKVKQEYPGYLPELEGYPYINLEELYPQ